MTKTHYRPYSNPCFAILGVSPPENTGKTSAYGDPRPPRSTGYFRTRITRISDRGFYAYQILRNESTPFMLLKIDF